jgi:hypothetical protein
MKNLSINLYDLWYKDPETLPFDVIQKEMCIYIAINKINGKGYIGYTQSRLIDR